MSTTRRRRLYWILQVSGWSAHALANLGFAALNIPLSWGIFAACVWGDFLAGLSSHLFRAYVLRHGWFEQPLKRTMPRIFLASILLGSAVTLVLWLSWLPYLGFDTWIHRAARVLPPNVFVWAVTIFLWAVLYFGVHYFERYKSAEVDKLQLAVVAKDAELRMLLAQINPHFIFNCLNSLRALIVEDPTRAHAMVDELSLLLRHSLQSERLRTVPLASELEAVGAYLKLESIRFEERLRVDIDACPAALRSEVPPMLVQTLVENGVKHGIANLPEGGEIRVTARASGGVLKIEVVNSGQMTEAAASTRIGIGNTRERLRLLYGDAASLLVYNRDASSVIAQAVLPAPEPSA